MWSQWVRHGYWCQMRWLEILVDERGQIKMAKVVQDDRKAKITHINTLNNLRRWKSISGHTTYQTLRQMGYSCCPHWDPLMSAKNRNLKLQLAWRCVSGCIPRKAVIRHDTIFCMFYQRSIVSSELNLLTFWRVGEELQEG